MKIGIPLLSLLAFLVATPGCASRPRASLPAYQVSTIDALLAGNYDAATTIGELARHGDLGIGTFTGLGGEMVALDGKFYDCRSDGRVVEARPDRGVPYATVLRFQPGIAVSGLAVADFADLARKLDAALPTPNYLYAVRIDGEFEHVHCRSVPPQAKPYPPLAEVVKQQAEFHYRQVSGTLLGFRSPPWSRGISVPGWHLHFIASDRSGGGHVLDVRFAGSTAKIERSQQFLLCLPGDAQFAKTDLAQDHQQELRQVEQAAR